ncbi:S8 family serine peptidase [Janthinobacterium sp. PC23-8]|uniref:S8 family serine peptidase n=1 Tax=Janthinobacterium sp. PC23-8 TaxID=2012679 RepID=UPI000B97170D|nr:S8 family serine peptidase [Janthinobacterium sp. PC23-8]OYO26676.1 peptidase S8 [Janthinobacterium sp. PC23-8]
MNHEKIAPGLMVAMENFQSQGETGLMPQMQTMGLVPSVGTSKPMRTVVFLDCDPNASLDHLAQHDIRINQSEGRFRTAILPFASLDALSQDAAIKRILPSRYLQPKLDVAGEMTHVTQWRGEAQTGGKNVIVGIIDTGIDASHEAFKGRILRIWDQQLRGDGVKEGGYGAELTPGLFSISRDDHGHGTHVAGIAGGADAMFCGVAPEAEFIIVKTSFMNAHIADAVRYIFRIASELNRPAVINLSLGGHFDAHDGSDPLSRIIDEQSGPGRLVCCAAGNEGTDDIHATAVVAALATQEIRFRVPATIRNITLNGWYDGDAGIEIALVSPLGVSTPFQAVIRQGNNAKSYQLPDAAVTVASPPPNLANGDHQFVVDLQGQRQADVNSGVWKLLLRNVAKKPATIHAWIMDDSQAASVIFTGAAVSDSMKIGSPGAAASAITVAAYTSRAQWNDIDMQHQDVGFAPDTISEFSSEGPLRNMQAKPDVTAPGAMIVSCLSKDSPARRRDIFREHFRVMAGTSMATPFITGLMALLLQQDAELDPAHAKDILRKISSIPGQSGTTFDNKWGGGLIDAAKLPFVLGSKQENAG